MNLNIAQKALCQKVAYSTFARKLNDGRRPTASVLLAPEQEAAAHDAGALGVEDEALGDEFAALLAELVEVLADAVRQEVAQDRVEHVGELRKLQGRTGSLPSATTSTFD